jgi:hypothetical protein
MILAQEARFCLSGVTAIAKKGGNHTQQRLNKSEQYFTTSFVFDHPESM